MRFTIASLFLLASLLFSVTSHAKLSCTLDETIGDVDKKTDFEFPLSAQGSGSINFSSLPGVATKGKITIENGVAVMTVAYPNTERTFRAESRIAKGSNSRFMVYLPAGNGFVDLSCADSEEAPVLPRNRLDCLFTERSNGQTLAMPFKAPIARGGHDTYELPPANLSKVTGWILGYPPLLVLFMMNETKEASITSMGLLTGRVSLSWFPNGVESTQVELRCEGEGIPLGGR